MFWQIGLTFGQCFVSAIGVKIVETLLSQARCENGPLPRTPGTMLCFFLFSTSLVASGTTLIRVEREGYHGKVLFGQVFFANNECVVASVLCWQLSQLILSPIVAVRTLKKSPHRNNAISAYQK